MSYATSRADLLGDAWGEYLTTGSGPAGGRVTSPNGDVVMFDADGQPASTIPHAGSGTDADVNRDPRSTFYGWTNLQMAAFQAAQGALVATDALRAAATPAKPGEAPSIPEEAIVASQAKLVALAASDPKVSAALETIKTGTFGSDVVERSAVSQASNDRVLRAQAEEWADWSNQHSARFADAAAREAFIADFIARAKSGSDQVGLSLEDAVKAGIMSAEAARRIQSGTTTPAPAKTVAAEGVYLKDGQYVDASGSKIPPAVLAQLGVAPPVSSSSGLSVAAPQKLLAAPAIADETGRVQSVGDGPGVPWAKIGLGALVVGAAALAMRKR